MWLEYSIKTKTVWHTYQVPGQGTVWPAITPDSAYTLGTLYTIKSMLAEGLLSEGMDKKWNTKMHKIIEAVNMMIQGERYRPTCHYNLAI